jgi:hypothetical protein
MSFPAYESYKDSGVRWLGAVPKHWTITKLRHIVSIPTKAPGNYEIMAPIDSWMMPPLVTG